MNRDIKTTSDIKLLVDSFYTEIRKDDLLGPVFENVIRDNWPTHLRRMYSFWETILLDMPTYQGNAFSLHEGLPVTHEHFLRWMELFTETTNKLFIGEKAEKAKSRAQKIASAFEAKIEYLNNMKMLKK